MWLMAVWSGPAPTLILEECVWADVLAVTGPLTAAKQD